MLVVLTLILPSLVVGSSLTIQIPPVSNSIQEDHCLSPGTQRSTWLNLGMLIPWGFDSRLKRHCLACSVMDCILLVTSYAEEVLRCPIRNPIVLRSLIQRSVSDFESSPLRNADAFLVEDVGVLIDRARSLLPSDSVTESSEVISELAESAAVVAYQTNFQGRYFRGNEDLAYILEDLVEGVEIFHVMRDLCKALSSKSKSLKRACRNKDDLQFLRSFFSIGHFGSREELIDIIVAKIT